MATAFCPSCDEEIRFSKAPKIGHTLSCPHCGEDLEVIDTNPIELDWAYDDEFEDDDYDDYDDE